MLSALQAYSGREYPMAFQNGVYSVSLAGPLGHRKLSPVASIQARLLADLVSSATNRPG